MEAEFSSNLNPSHALDRCIGIDDSSYANYLAEELCVYGNILKFQMFGH